MRYDKLTGVPQAAPIVSGRFPRREVTMAVALAKANLNHLGGVDELVGRLPCHRHS